MFGFKVFSALTTVHELQNEIKKERSERSTNEMQAQSMALQSDTLAGSCKSFEATADDLRIELSALKESICCISKACEEDACLVSLSLLSLDPGVAIHRLVLLKLREGHKRLEQSMCAISRNHEASLQDARAKLLEKVTAVRVS